MHQDHVQYTIKAPKQTNHVLHLLLTLGTCGAWGFVWLAVAMWNAFAKDKTQVQGAWYGPIARPYEVGPGAPVSGMNPLPSVPPVAMPPMPPYVGRGPGYPPNMTKPPPWSLGPDVVVCTHGKAMTITCEDCPRLGSVPQ